MRTIYDKKTPLSNALFLHYIHFFVFTAPSHVYMPCFRRKSGQFMAKYTKNARFWTQKYFFHDALVELGLGVREGSAKKRHAARRAGVEGETPSSLPFFFSVIASETKQPSKKPALPLRPRIKLSKKICAIL